MKLLRAVAAVLILSGFSAAAQAGEIVRSGPAKVSLLEVFSSEGCSSCPPAEKWVTLLEGQKGLWKDFVPVVFHVDYWDKLGWKDPYSAPVFTGRQTAYAGYWGNGSVYTPAFVLDGREWRGWLKWPAPPRGTGEDAGVLTVKDRDGRYEIFYDPPPQAGIHVRVHAALLGSALESQVTAGENEGKLLRHDFTVLDYVETEMNAAGPRWEAVLDLNAPDWAPTRAIAVWISDGKSPAPLQAAGASL